MYQHIINAITNKLKNGYLESNHFQEFLQKKIEVLKSTKINLDENNIEEILDNIFSNLQNEDAISYSKLITENSGNAVALLGVDKIFKKEIVLECNPVFLEKINSQSHKQVNKEDVIGSSLEYLLENLKVLTATRKESLLNKIRNNVDFNKQVNYTEFLEQKNQKSYWDTKIEFIKHDDKSYIVYTSKDVSEKKELENDLKRFRKALNHIRDSIFIINSRTAKIVDVNESACSNLGYTKHELLGKYIGEIEGFFSVYDKIGWKEYIEEIKNSFNHSQVLEEIQQKKNGEMISVELSIKYESFQNRDYLIIVSRDISEQQKIKAEIKANRERYYNIFNAVNDVILIHDAETGEIIDTNKKAMDLFGYSIQEIKKGGIELLGDSSSLFKAEKIIKNIKLLNRGREDLFEWKARDVKNNSYWFDMSLKSTEIMGKTYVLSVCRNISSRKRIENRLSKLSSKLLKQNRQLENKEQDLVKSNRELKNKQKELETTLEELSARNFELDQLVYKVSHDLRSPLSSILGLINIIQNEKSLGTQLKYLDYIENRVRKLDGFIKAMLNYAKVNRSEVEKVKINFEEIIQTCIDDLEYLENFGRMKTDIKIEDNQNDFWSDELRMNVIFNNIISNAYKYMNLQEEQSFLKIYINIQSTGLEVQFKDNGIGIPEEFLDKIFDMFFRATNNSEGSGLGMYIVKQTIDKLQGTIKVESQSNKGTEIYIFLPR